MYCNIYKYNTYNIHIYQCVLKNIRKLLPILLARPLATSFHRAHLEKRLQRTAGLVHTHDNKLDKSVGAASSSRKASSGEVRADYCRQISHTHRRLDDDRHTLLRRRRRRRRFRRLLASLRPVFTQRRFPAESCLRPDCSNLISNDSDATIK